jgi:hypothetical protein
MKISPGTHEGRVAQRWTELGCLRSACPTSIGPKNALCHDSERQPMSSIASIATAELGSERECWLGDILNTGLLRERPRSA